MTVNGTDRGEAPRTVHRWDVPGNRGAFMITARVTLVVCSFALPFVRAENPTSASAASENPAAILEMLPPGAALAPGAEKARVADGSCAPGAAVEAKESIRVKVIDSDGKPVAGAAIHRSVWTDEPYEANADFATDANGEAMVSLPRSVNILRLWARKETYAPLFVDWEPQSHIGVTVPAEFTFALEKGTQIGGYVVNEEGSPVEGARVEVAVDTGSPVQDGRADYDRWLAEGKEARVTDSRGFWSLENSPPEVGFQFRFKVSHPDYISDKNWVSAKGNQEISESELRQLTSTIVMPAGTVISGDITDPEGAPVPKALVVLGNEPDGQEVRADAQGHYRCPPLPQGALTVTVIAPDWSPEIKQITVAPAMLPQDFNLKRGNSIRIQFVDAAGQPVPNVKVAIQMWRYKKSLYNTRRGNLIDTHIPSQADKNGVYVWNWAPEDAVTLSFWKQGFHPLEDQPTTPGEYRVELSK